MSRGITLTVLARRLDTTPTTVSRWLAGRHPAPRRLLDAIAEVGGRELADTVAGLIPDSATEVAA